MQLMATEFLCACLASAERYADVQLCASLCPSLIKARSGEVVDMMLNCCGKDATGLRQSKGWI